MAKRLLSTKAELAESLDDYEAMLQKLEERARDFRGLLEINYPSGEGPGFQYEEGWIAGWEDLVQVAKDILSARRELRAGRQKVLQGDTQSYGDAVPKGISPP